MGPQTQFVRVDGADVAYQVVGEGDTDLLLMAGSATNVDVWWDYPEAAQLWSDLASAGRLILFDRRGAGASERISADRLPAWTEWAVDAEAVLDAVGSKSAYIIAVLDAGPVALLLATRRPELVRGLVLIRSAARILRGAGYNHGHTQEEFDTWCNRFRELWGSADWVKTIYPGARDPRFMEWSLRHQRASYSPRVAAEFMRQWGQVDARYLLSEIRVSTLVVGRHEEFVGIEHSLFLANNVSAAEMLEFGGTGGLLETVGELRRPILDFIGGRLTSVEGYVLLTDIVGSTQQALTLGEESWSRLLDRHDLMVRVAVDEGGGKLIKTTGDGVLALFDTPDGAINAAAAAIKRLRDLNLELRAGVHCGPVIGRGSDIGGLTVHLASRVMSQAGPGEILVSHRVASAIEGRFALSAPAEIELKGFADRVAVQRILGVAP